MNILVTKFYTIQSHSEWYNNRSNEVNLEDNYLAMIELMQASAKRSIKDLDQIIVHKGTVSDIREAFKQDYWKIRNLWSQGHNILYVDADVLFVKPVDIFNQLDQHTFRMFNYTDPPSLHHAPYVFPHYFNCGIRYYPQHMDQSVWAIGDAKFGEHFDKTHWDEEQRIYNSMMWSQGDNTVVSKFHQPELAFQMLSGNTQLDNHFNGIDQADAKIMHIHGSRGSGNRLNHMAQLNNTSIEIDIST